MGLREHAWLSLRFDDRDLEMENDLSNIVASVGLVLDIVGVFLIWKFGLGCPLVVKSSEGKDIEVMSGKSEERVTFQRMDQAGFVLLILGFTLQIFAVWMRP